MSANYKLNVTNLQLKTFVNTLYKVCKVKFTKIELINTILKSLYRESAGQDGFSAIHHKTNAKEIKHQMLLTFK